MHEFNFSIYGLPRVMVGAGRSLEVGVLAKELSGSRVLLLTDKNIVETQTFKGIIHSLKEASVYGDLWVEEAREPSTVSVDHCVRSVPPQKFDLLIGVGGGSVLDLTKMVGIILGLGGHAADYLGQNLVPDHGLPTILVPTTAGTGAEATPNAIFRSEPDGEKKAVISKHLLPDAVILDPQLTVDLPSKITAATGLDALTHSVESYVANRANPVSDGLALESIRLIFEGLPKVMQNGGDLGARTDMLMGSFLGGIALSIAGTGAVHALAYGLAAFGVSHGVANGLLLPATMQFNAPCCQEKLAMIARFTDPQIQCQVAEQAASTTESLSHLVEQMPIPHKLSELGITAENLPDIIRVAMGYERLLSNNPRTMKSHEAKAILVACL